MTAPAETTTSRLVLEPILPLLGAAALLGGVSIAARTPGTVVAVLVLLVGLVFAVTGLTQRCLSSGVLGVKTDRETTSTDRNSFLTTAEYYLVV